MFKLVDRFISAAYSSNALRQAVRALFRALPRADIAVNTKEGVVHTNSPDRLLAALLWKYRLGSSLEYSLYSSLIRPGMTVLDIGANIGFLTLLFSRLAGGTGKVIALEPDPGNFGLLRRNVEANGRLNVRCENMAAAPEEGTIRLFRSEEHHGDHRIFDSGDGRDSIEIRAASIDDLLGPGGKADFIKIDVQGAETLVLKGMGRTIRESPGLKILCEFCPYLLEKAGASPDALLDMFASYGFGVKYLDEDLHSLKPASREELKRLCPGENYLNLLLEKPAR